MMSRMTLVLLTFAALVTGGLLAQETNDVNRCASEAGTAMEDCASAADGAKAKLKAASAMRRTSFKKPADEKERILLAAAAAYEEIVRLHADCHAECAEATFRAGEIYRTLRMADRAEAAFMRALEFQTGGEFAARSLNEVGHLYRRKKDYPHAMAYYRRVLSECADVRDECADAWTWIGKVYLKVGENEKGLETLVDFADRFPEFPVAAIRNIDLAALALIKEGRFDEAAEMIDRCVRRFESAEGDDDKQAKAIEKALGKMKSVEKLQARRTEEEKKTAES